jgi:predicted TIM-barrel fold metal-dependent hydrolase
MTVLIDAHAHLGDCDVFGANQEADALLANMDGAGVDLSIVQPFPGALDPRGVHDAIAQLARSRPGRVVGLASLNPHRDSREYKDEIARCVKELGFVGVKLHTIGHAVKPGSRAATVVFETAAELGIPVMIHTGPGVPFAEPANWIPMARAFAETPVVLAHAGASLYTGPAVVAAETCDNIYLETSWCNPQDMKGALASLGAGRLMFGSDMMFNIGVEKAKYGAIGLSEAEQSSVFSQTAATVFNVAVGQPGRSENPHES